MKRETSTAAGRVTKTVDLRPTIARWGLGARKQGQRPTCSVFATVNAIEYALAVRSGKGVKISQEFLNWAKNKVAGTEQDGDFFNVIWAGYEKYGLATEKAQPYSETYDPKLEPTAKTLKDAVKYRAKNLKQTFIKLWDPNCGLTDVEFKAVLRRIDSGRPVMCGLRWAKKSEYKDGVLQWCPAEEVFDGHSIMFVGYCLDATVEGGGYFIFSDSGGSHPDGKMSFKFAKDYANDACWVK